MLKHDKDLVYDTENLDKIDKLVLDIIWDGNSKYVAHIGRKMSLFLRKKIQICDGSRSKQMPLTDQIRASISELPTNLSTTRC